MTKPNQAIAGQALTALTGLTDRRHRQLASEGFFPAPIRGEYELAPTIRGVIRYYREAHHRTTESIAAERLRKTREEADKLAIENAVARGELVDVRDFIKRYEPIYAQILQTIVASGLSDNDKDALRTALAKLHSSEGKELPSPRKARTC